MYEHAKTSFINRANELKTNERRNFGRLGGQDENDPPINNFASSAPENSS